MKNFDIEKALYQRYTGADRLFDVVDLGKFSSSLRPGLNVAVLNGSFKRVGQKGCRQDLEIIAVITYENIASEIERRRVIHPLCEYLFQDLFGAKLTLTTTIDGVDTVQELDLDEIIPVDWKERTTITQFNASQIVFEVRFSTSSNITAKPATPEQEQALVELLGQYRMPESLDDPDAEPVAEDDLSFTGATP